MTLLQLMSLVSYYGFTRHLPASDNKYGKWTRVFRRVTCRALFRYMGHGVNVESGACFGTGLQIEIGDFSGIGINCRIYGPVYIGNYVMIGPDVIILTSNHRYNKLDTPMMFQGGMPHEPVRIEDDVWIGTRTIILPGVRIGKGAIIGAGSVVTKDIPSYAIVAGNPAKIIRYRNDNSDLLNSASQPKSPLTATLWNLDSGQAQLDAPAGSKSLHHPV